MDRNWKIEINEWKLTPCVFEQSLHLTFFPLFWFGRKQFFGKAVVKASIRCGDRWTQVQVQAVGPHSHHVSLASPW